MNTLDSLKKVENPVALDQLAQDVNETKKSLDALKQETQSTEREKKTEVIKTQISILKSKISEALQRETDDAKKQQIWDLQKQLETTSSELFNLAQDVVTNQNEWDLNTKEKGLWDKTKDFVSENFTAVTTAESWKKETGMNVLRTAGFAAAGYAARSAVKGAWNRMFWDDEEEKKNKKSESEDLESWEKKEKKSFWKTGWWKFIKWTWIGVWAGTAGYYLGKWFWWWWTEADKSDKERFENYDDFMKNHPEEAKRYEVLWGNIDQFYTTLYQPELAAGYQDELEMARISKEQSENTKLYKGVIPFCLDDKFGTVDAILGQNSSMKNAISWGLNSMMQYVKNLGTDFVQKFIASYLSKLPSWAPFANSSDSAEEKLEKWKAENQQAERELQYFFRQSIRVQTYLMEKKEQLIDKIATEQATVTGKAKEVLLSDDDLREKYIMNDAQYQAFMSSPLRSSTKILQEKGIFDAVMSDTVKTEVEILNKERSTLLWAKGGEKDILQALAEKKVANQAPTEEEKKKLTSSCDAIIKEVDDKIYDAAEASAWNIYGDLLNTQDSTIREYLEKSGLEKVLDSYKQKIREAQTKLKEGKLDQNQIFALSDSINNMLALKKEIMLGASTIHKDIDENGNIIYRIPGFCVDSVNNLKRSVESFWWGEWIDASSYLASSALGTGVTLTVVGWVVYIVWSKTAGKKMIKTWLTITTLPASLAWLGGKKLISNSRTAQRFVDKMHYGMPRRYLSWTEFKWEKGPEKLMEALKRGDLKLSKAANVMQGKIWGHGTGKSEKIWTEYFGLPKSEKWDFIVAEKIFDKYVSETKTSDTFLKELKQDPDLYQKVIKNFDNGNEVRLAIAGDEGLENLRTIVDRVDSRVAIQTGGRAADTAGEVTEHVAKNTNVYKQVQRDFDNELKILEEDASQASWAKKAQIEKRIEALTEFRDSILKKTEAEIAKSEELLSIFKKGKNLTYAAEQLHNLSKLEGQKFVFTLFDANWNAIEKNLDTVIKELDDAAILSLKGKGTWVADDALEALADTFKVAKTQKNLLKNGDEILTTVKTAIKFFAKMT